MQKKPIYIGNWKMNFSEEDVKSFFREFTLTGDEFYIGFAVPAPYIKIAVEAASTRGIKIGSQNCHWEDKGAFTGELSSAMLKDCGATFTLIGHSERRQYFGETDFTVNKRALKTLKEGILTVLCIGETKDEYQSGKRNEVLSRQIELGLGDISTSDLDNLIIAYEPVWAIGTGLSATQEEAKLAHDHIKNELQRGFPQVGSRIPVIYGGSVTSKNSKELMGVESIDGVLVGGASLKPEDFADIINNSI